MIKLATGKACPRGIITLTRHKSGNYRNDKPAMFSKSLQGLCTVIAKKNIIRKIMNIQLKYGQYCQCFWIPGNNTT